MMKRYFVLFVICLPFQLFSQNGESTVFSLDSFLNVVKNNHPLAIQANLQVEKGAASLQTARGAFDPKLQADIAQKYYKGVEYYDLGESKLKIPTWFGIELEGGYERNQGEFINPQNDMPSAGLWFAGITLPIGEGLFIDERRAELRKAQSIVAQSEAEKDLLLNELLFNAGVAYWDWFMSYNNLRIYGEAFDLAQYRFNAVKQSTLLGDAPSIDTLEAGIQLQNRTLNLEEAKLNFKNATAFLSVYLWKDGVIPLEIKNNVIPDSMENIIRNVPQIKGEIDSLLNIHPELRIGYAKIQQLAIEERWSKEQLKPTINLKYQPLVEAVGNDPLANYFCQ